MRERDRKKERESGRENVCMRETERECVCERVCVRERKREREAVAIFFNWHRPLVSNEPGKRTVEKN